MKKIDLIITLTLAIVLLASIVDAQRTSRLTRPCSATTTPAAVEIERDGDINITPCSGGTVTTGGSGIFKAYDPTFTSPFASPVTSRFTVGSQSYQTLAADQNYFGTDLLSRITLQNTAAKTTINFRSQLTAQGSPTGQTALYGILNVVDSGSTWSPGVLYATGIASNVDVGSGASGIVELTGLNATARVGSVNVASVTNQYGVRAITSFGYAATVTDLVGVQAFVSAISDFGGTATNVKLFQATKSTTNSDITNLYGVYVGNYGGGSGPIANSYGLFLDSTIGVGTTNYAIYSQSSAPSLLAGKLSFDATYTAGGTTGNQTINKPAFSVNFAAAASSLTVTNSFVAATSVLLCTVQANDSTLKSVAAVAGSGSVVLHANAAATAETKVYCEVKN